MFLVSDLVAQEKSLNGYEDLQSARLTVSDVRISSPSSQENTQDHNIVAMSHTSSEDGIARLRNKRNRVDLGARAPHPATLISPTASQNITLGEAFDCQVKDGVRSDSRLCFLRA